MAKYSTGEGGGGSSGSCELCGAADVELSTATVAGATLEVCDSCAEHGETQQSTSSGGGSGGNDTNRQKKAAQNTAKVYDAAQGDSSHWEDGADYEDDQLPYLVKNYGERVTEARQDAGYQTQELADELDVDEKDILAVEQGRAIQAGVGGSVVEALEEHLDVELVESR